MFSGIVVEVGKIRKVVRKSLIRLEIVSNLDLTIGDSVSVDGVCLTVVKRTKGYFAVEISQDTANRTTLKKISTGKEVNLEPPLRVGDYLSGHFVSGHVDTTSRIIRKRKIDGEFIYTFSIPKGGVDYLIPMGSITIDGISFTVKEVERNYFSVTVIPQTIKSTTIGNKKVGDLVNIEYDLIARYLKQWTSRS
ncbi:MAG TPA: riboflavin synthase [bacterium (Candidatus Stahlbacteria)]|nr:riboflavin synthase [Candidatus Stahlbacteria bacterium]